VRRLKAAGIDFVLPPQCRFEGQPGEQWTMFFVDPSADSARGTSRLPRRIPAAHTLIEPGT